VLNDERLNEYFARLGLPETARSLIRKIRGISRAQAHDIRSGAPVGSLYSAKMGRKYLQLRGRIGDYALATLFELDPEVLEYWPCPYQTASQKRRGALTLTKRHPPDFLVLKENGAGFVEYHDDSSLREAIGSGRRYCEEAIWRCCNGPAERWAKERGLKYAIVSSAHLSRQLLDNVQFLQDYFRAPALPTERASAIAGVLSIQGSISLRGLLQSFSVHEIYTAIVQGIAYVDLTCDRLSCSDDFKVHCNAARSRAEKLRLDTRQRLADPSNIAKERRPATLRPQAMAAPVFHHDCHRFAVSLMGTELALRVESSGNSSRLIVENVERYLVNDCSACETSSADSGAAAFSRGRRT
jgi:hypothetical protein